jgi:hypothetical protein
MKNTASRIVDGFIGKKIANLKPTKKVTYNLPESGPYAKMTWETSRPLVSALKKVSKFLGSAAAVFTGYDVYKDYRDYRGNARHGAAATDIIGAVVAIGAAVVITTLVAATLPAWR